ncbi:class I tRNA ligase family protein [Candidatus Gracilibacteria bacterium]|nr:class I tRNA ligase family protein [Candidatus Gracilibacteria bacterium]
MKDFSKKYNYHIIEKEIDTINEQKRTQASNIKGNIFLTNPIPISSDLHLGNLFSLTYSDILKTFLEMINKSNYYRNVGFYSPQGFKSTNTKIISNIKTSYNKKKSNRKQIKKSGLTFYDSISPYSVIDQDYMFNVREFFYDLHKTGKIYEDNRIVYRSHIHQSLIGNDDVELQKIKGKKYNIRFFIETKNDSIVISTGQPHTIFSDVALLVHPQDKRYKKFVGSNVLIPIINKPIPIIADETVDTLKNNGILRVTPCHEELGLKLAQKHNLPTDICSVDDQGNFTEITGIFYNKKVDDFFDNIIQYLGDISNLDSVVDYEYEIPVLKKTGETLYKILKKQRFLKVSSDDKDKFKELLESEINISPNEYKEDLIKKLNDTNTWCISRQYGFGQQIPVREDTIGRTYTADSMDIVNKLIKTRKSRKVILTMIVFNLILDAYLQPEFSIDNLVDILFSPSSFGEKTIIEYYIEIFNKLLSQNQKTKSFLPEIKELKTITDIIGKTRKSSFEKIQLLLDILKKSYLIESEGENYVFQINELFENRYKMNLQKFIFDSYFLRCFWIIYNNKLNIANTKSTILIGEDNIDFLIKAGLINIIYDGNFSFDKIFFQPTLLNEKNKAISQNDNIVFDSKDILKNYSKDAFRLSFLINGDQKELTYQITNLNIAQKFLDKFWNASRFMIQNFNQSNKSINLKKIKKNIETNYQNLHEIDIWLIYTFKELIESINSNSSKLDIIALGNDIIKAIRDNLFDRYLEIIKENKSDITSQVAIYHLILSLKMINPYVPFISTKISNILGIDLDSIQIDDFVFDTNHINKNYKIHLLFDIISKISNLRNINCLKQHENIDILIQANTDFIKLIQDYELLLKKLLKINNIEYIRPHQQISDNYQIDSVVNITIGFKSSDFRSEKTRLHSLLDQVSEKQDHLQNIRNILSSIKAIPSNKDEIDKKTKEMKKLKKEILDIECQINNIKMNK